MISATVSMMPNINKDFASKIKRAMQDAIGRLNLMEDNSNMAKSGSRSFDHAIGKYRRSAKNLGPISINLNRCSWTTAAGLSQARVPSRPQSTFYRRLHHEIFQKLSIRTLMGMLRYHQSLLKPMSILTVHFGWIICNRWENKFAMATTCDILWEL